MEQSVNHYRLVKKLGSGGMGEVYLAEDTRLKRNVALKFLPDHLSKEPGFKARFEHEAQAVAALDHPNIISIYELGEHDGRLYIAMQYLDGRTLQEMLDTEEISLKDALKIVEQICSGLAKAHEEGVIHRDIKPANIFVTNEGVVKILDFGLAKSRRSTTQTKTGTTVGTLQYESPEQCRGEKVDRRSDIFSVGVLLYQLITGRLPFTGDYDAAIVYAISHETPEPIARYKSGTTGQLQQIVDKALSKDPSLRYQHADGMLADLKRLHVDIGVQKGGRGILWVVLGALLVIIIVLVLMQPWGRRSSVNDADQIMLAVLPFENLGTEDDEVFADGITEEITSRLGMIKELGVISRTSTMRYKNTDKALPVIAKELGVEFILEGTVRWDDRGDIRYVRITPQLINASKNTHVWTDIYEEKLESVFQIQGSIASEIAAELDLTLVESVRKEMKSPPTESIDAYTAYLKALEYDRLPGNVSHNIDRSILMFEQAIEIDSNFALAWAGLSYSNLRRYNGYGQSSLVLNVAKKTADRSLKIDPNLAEGHLALGYYYRLCYQFDEALAELELAERYRPSLARIYDHRAIVMEQQTGFSELSERESLRAVKLDPLDGSLLTSVAEMYIYKREPEKTIYYLDKAISIAPHEPGGYVAKARWLLDAGYDLDVIREINKNPVYQSADYYPQYAVDVEIAARKYDLALTMLDTCLVRMPDAQHQLRLKRAWVTWLKGDTVTARSIYDSLRVYLEKAVEKEDRNNELDYNELARCYAILGEKEKALDAAEKVLGFVVGDKTATLDRKADLARTCSLVGEHDKAVDILEEILAIPNRLSIPALELHPEWDPLRDHPRFKALIAEFGSQ